MTKGEAVNWLINITADIGKAEHRDLWHYEQALSEIREMLEELPIDEPEIIRCKDCRFYDKLEWCALFQPFADGVKDMDTDDFCSRAERRSDEL